MKNTVFWVVTPHSSERAEILDEHIASIFRTQEQVKQETSNWQA
jgi:hypothetical protein